MVVLRIKSQLSVIPVAMNRIGMAGTGVNPLFSAPAGKQQQGQENSEKRFEKRFSHAKWAKVRKAQRCLPAGCKK